MGGMLMTKILFSFRKCESYEADEHVFILLEDYCYYTIYIWFIVELEQMGHTYIRTQ